MSKIYKAISCRGSAAHPSTTIKSRIFSNSKTFSLYQFNENHRNQLVQNARDSVYDIIAFKEDDMMTLAVLRSVAVKAISRNSSVQGSIRSELTKLKHSLSHHTSPKDI